VSAIETAGYRQDRMWWAARQRIVILTFDTTEEAEAWDNAGQPIELGTTTAVVEVR
jgi:hypothetical protein